jgi:hypothetical protein
MQYVLQYQRTCCIFPAMFGILKSNKKIQTSTYIKNIDVQVLFTIYDKYCMHVQTFAGKLCPLNICTYEIIQNLFIENIGKV